MLTNLSGEQGLPSEELISDLRTLCASSTSDLKHVAKTFSNLPDETTRESAYDALIPTLRSLEIEPMTAVDIAKVVLFLWQRWAAQRLTRSDIIADLQSIDINEEQLQNLSPLLDAIESKIGFLQNQQARAAALATGTPRIDSAICVLDARAIFASSEHEEELGDQQPYFELDHFVPIATLEIISELNDHETTHSYLLTETTLDQLCNVLERAKKRLQIIKSKTCTD